MGGALSSSVPSNSSRVARPATLLTHKISCSSSAIPLISGWTVLINQQVQTVFYRWQKEFFENGAAAFETKHATQNKTEQKRIEQLEAKLQIKNEVLSELMEEHVYLKKELGVL